MTLNVHGFQSGILDINEQEVFDVSNCFDRVNQSVWFQLMYPVRNVQLFSNRTNAIEAAFRRMMADIPPYRLPRVTVDFDANFVIVSAKLLEGLEKKSKVKF